MDDVLSLMMFSITAAAKKAEAYANIYQAVYKMAVLSGLYKSMSDVPSQFVKNLCAALGVPDIGEEAAEFVKVMGNSGN